MAKTGKLSRNDDYLAAGEGRGVEMVNAAVRDADTFSKSVGIKWKIDGGHLNGVVAAPKF